MLSIDHPQLSLSGLARICIALHDVFYVAGLPPVPLDLGTNLDQFAFVHVSIVRVEDGQGNLLESVLEDLLDEAVPSPQSVVQEPIVVAGAFRIMHPADRHGHVLGSMIDEGLDLSPCRGLVGSFPLGFLFPYEGVFFLQAIQHALELGLGEVHAVDPPSLDTVDVLVAVAVHVLELFNLRAGGEGEFVLDHASSIGAQGGHVNEILAEGTVQVPPVCELVH